MTTDLVNDVAARLVEADVRPILKVLTDGMFWENEGPAWTCLEAEAIAAAAVALGADEAEMAALVVSCHGAGDDEGDMHYHQEEL